MKNLKLFRSFVTSVFFVVFGYAVTSHGQNKIAEFDTDHWEMKRAKIVEHMGRKSLMGVAYLKDVNFENGIVEVDFAVNGKRSYPGILFRVQSEDDFERFYIRPHRSGLYSDDLQYTPSFNGISGWQLYSGEGFTAAAVFPEDQWFRLKIEFAGKQARVYLNDGEQPILTITDLKHGISKGTLGLLGPQNGTAYFSNFSYRSDNNLHFKPAPKVETAPGIITDWQISQSFKFSKVDYERTPNEQGLNITWQKVTSEPSGLVDIARYVKRMDREPDLIIAKTTIYADKEESRKLQFGYSDDVSIFLNGKLLFAGKNGYQQRDPAYLGIVGFNDMVYLPLKKGNNKLLLMVAETFGGWGFMCREGNTVYNPGTK